MIANPPAGASVLRLKIALARLLSGPYVGATVSRLCRNQIRRHGVTIDTSPAGFSASVRAQIAFGIYESAEIRFIREYLKGFTKVLELGSSLGVSAAHIIDVSAAGAEIVCVEANPFLLPTLRATTASAAARAGSHVRTIHGAVSSDQAYEGTVLLELGGSHLGSKVVTANDSGAQRPICVPRVDLADATRDWSDYALVCDIEGAEADLIFSAHPVLLGARRLVIELHDGNYKGSAVTAGDLRQSLVEAGFQVLAERGRVLALEGPAAGATYGTAQRSGGAS